MNTDGAEQKQGEDAHREHEIELERQTRQQEALLQISQAVQALSKPSDLERVVQVCYEQLQSLSLNFQGLAIQRLVEEESHRFETYEVLPSKRINRLVVSAPNLYRIWQSEASLYRPNLELDLEGLTPDALERMCKRYEIRIRCLLNVLHSRGLISLVSTQPDAFDEGEIQFVEQVGQMLSLGMSRVEDLEQLNVHTQALSESEERFRKIFEEGPLGMALVDLDYRFSKVNATLCRMVGYTEQELTELTFPDITHPEDVDKDVRLAEQMFRGEVPFYKIEKRYITKNGEPLWITLTASVIRDEDGKPLYGLAMIEDITGRKRTEQESVRLERLHALGEMAKGVAHNFNNMLVGMLGYAQLIQAKDAGSETGQYAGRIVESALRAKEMVGRLNQAVRGEREDTIRPLPVNEVVRDIVQTASPRWKDEAEARGIAIDVVADLAEVPPVQGTQSRLHDILINLLFNAVDALPEGGAITIGTRAVGKEVLVTVRDTGLGMDEETRRRVFEPFFTTKSDVGSGLGLSTVYGTVTRWGGTIGVESAPGRGALFTIRLPAWTGPEPEVEEEETVGRRARRARVLVVEDDRMVCEFLSSMLSSHHEVETTPDGREALRRFAPGRYDVALIDLGMPGMPGDEVAREMRQADPKVALVLVTGWALKDGDPRALAFDFRIQKPFTNLRDVWEVVDRAVELCDERAGEKG